jgi:hypothetical protein
MLTAPRFVPTVVLALALAVAVIAVGSASAAPGRDSGTATRAGGGGDRAPSSAGDTPSSRGSVPTTPAPTSGSSSGASSTVSNDHRGDARHGSGGHSGGGSGHGGGHWGGYHGGYGGYYGGYGGYYGGYYGPGYYPYWAWWGYWPGYAYYDGPYSRGGGEAGALDIDIAPGKTEVWVDGALVGTADDYDGFPTFLWLPRGTYDVVFFRPGYTTLARQYTVYPGLIIDVEDRMAPGEATRPEDLVSKSTERREARLQSDREQEAEVEAWERAHRDDWRQRRGGAYSEDARAESGAARVLLQVEPSDASIYLDERFLGTGDDLARLPSGFAIEPGDYELKIVRPGYRPERVTLSVEAGETEAVEVVLETYANP